MTVGFTLRLSTLDVSVGLYNIERDLFHTYLILGQPVHYILDGVLRGLRPILSVHSLGCGSFSLLAVAALRQHFQHLDNLVQFVFDLSVQDLYIFGAFFSLVQTWSKICQSKIQ